MCGLGWAEMTHLREDHCDHVAADAARRAHDGDAQPRRPLRRVAGAPRRRLARAQPCPRVGAHVGLHVRACGVRSAVVVSCVLCRAACAAGAEATARHTAVAKAHVCRNLVSVRACVRFGVASRTGLEDPLEAAREGGVAQATVGLVELVARGDREGQTSGWERRAGVQAMRGWRGWAMWDGERGRAERRRGRPRHLVARGDREAAHLRRVVAREVAVRVQVDREERDEADGRVELLLGHVRARNKALADEEHGEQPARRVGPEGGPAAVDPAGDPPLRVGVEQRAGDEQIGDAEVVGDEEEADRVPVMVEHAAKRLSAWAASS